MKFWKINSRVIKDHTLNDSEQSKNWNIYYYYQHLNNFPFLQFSHLFHTQVSFKYPSSILQVFPSMKIFLKYVCWFFLSLFSSFLTFLQYPTFLSFQHFLYCYFSSLFFWFGRVSIFHNNFTYIIISFVFSPHIFMNLVLN